jgi:Tol biopolymer transport system component
MRRLGLFAVTLACLLAPAGAAQAASEEGLPVPVAGRAADSDAPPNAAPHWLPSDIWVHMHWIPFDEGRLHALLKTDRDELWAWLRHDTQTIAQLAALRGWKDPRKLATALVAPRAGEVSPKMLRDLRSRALRILVQGHLSQHVLLHMLHQEVGPHHARDLFGVKDTKSFQALRRMDLSPLRIGRSHGRTRAQMQRGLERELRHAAHEGVMAGATTERQAQLVLQRQLRQVPRWLGEDHYNGPPQTKAGKLLFAFRPSFASPVISDDGQTVMFDAQQAAPPLAVRYGEVVLEGRELAGGTQIDPRDASTQALADRPCSSYDASLSGDGKAIAFEIAAGNRTFAKRYGNVVVALADLRTQTVRALTGARSGSRVQTAYDPSLADDGTVVAYQSVSADPMSPGSGWSTRVELRNVATGATTAVSHPGGAYEPELSGDGGRVAYTAFSRGRLQVYVRDRATGRSLLASTLAGAGRAAEAWAPSLSRDGRHVAFAAKTRAEGRARVYVRDLSQRAARAASGPTAGFADEPSLSADGAQVAWSEQPRGASPSRLGRPGQRLLIRNLAGGKTRVVSLAADGDPLGGWNGQPQLSGDGRRIAFTSDANTPPAGGPGGLQVLVRDLAARTTTVANPVAPLGSFDTGAGALAPAPGPLCSLAAPAW